MQNNLQLYSLIYPKHLILLIIPYCFNDS